MNYTEDLIADYVIVGTGTAGSVLARLLSDDYVHTVISIEAGENNSCDIPVIDSTYIGTGFGLEQNYYPNYFWQIDTAPQSSINLCDCCDTIKFGTNDSQEVMVGKPYTGGRMLGGSSSINAEQYVRGTPELFRQWAEITGDNRWSPENVLEAFKEIEKYNGKTDRQSNHGYCGLVDIRQAPHIPSQLAIKFVSAIKLAINVDLYPENDYNVFFPEQPYIFGSFIKWQLFQKPDTTRVTSDSAFLDGSIMSSNGVGLHGRKLRVLLKTTLVSIIWNGDHVPRAIGIVALSNGKTIRIKTRGALIICAGILSAYILQQNGIGSAKYLESIGIRSIVDNDNVGKHMTNHLLMQATLVAKYPEAVDTEFAALFTGGAFLPPLLSTDNPKMHGYQLVGTNPEPGVFNIIVIYLQPKSTGIILAQSSDPLKVPLVDTKYFSDERDILAYQLAFKEYVLPIADKMNAFGDNYYTVVSPDIVTVNDSELFRAYAIANYNITYHWQSMVRMGRSMEDSVVNSVGEVFGTANLLCCDATITPIQTDANIGSTAFLVAWVIGHYILNKANRYV